MSDTHWYVKDTPFWPARYKVTFDWRGQDYGSNETHNFFRDLKEAQTEADRRNSRDNKSKTV